MRKREGGRGREFLRPPESGIQPLLPRFSRSAQMREKREGKEKEVFTYRNWCLLFDLEPIASCAGPGSRCDPPDQPCPEVKGRGGKKKGERKTRTCKRLPLTLSWAKEKKGRTKARTTPRYKPRFPVHGWKEKGKSSPISISNLSSSTRKGKKEKKKKKKGPFTGPCQGHPNKSPSQTFKA